MNEKAQFNEGIPCDICGRFGAFVVGERHLCGDCYEAQGSCCLEFGADDLWKVCEQRETSKEHEDKGQT